MIITSDIKESIEKSVLCWLATVSAGGQPNVSPKEVFTYYGEDWIIIANIASPQTIKNINLNKKVCVSFIDVLVQKGYQVKGIADIVSKTNTDFPEMEKELVKITKGEFPIASIIRVKVESSKPIIAPRYILYPGTTEEEQIESARRLYGI